MVFTIGDIPSAQAEISAADRKRFAEHTQKILEAARKRYEQSPTNVVAAWEFARASFDRAEFAANDSEREALAERGIAVCRRALFNTTNSSQLHYYLGLNLAQLARTKTLGALKILPEMEREFKAAIALDEKFDYAGAHHSLGVLYYEAPGFSVGSDPKARKELERAAEVAPDFPENRIYLAEAYLKWREKKPLQQQLDALEKLWPIAKTNLTGLDWENAWLDWTQRREKLKKEAAKILKP